MKIKHVLATASLPDDSPNTHLHLTVWTDAGVFVLVARVEEFQPKVPSALDLAEELAAELGKPWPPGGASRP